MLKIHPITAFMKMHADFQKIFLIRVFWFKYIFPIKYKIHILDLMLLPKNSVPFEGLYYSRKGTVSQYIQVNRCIAKTLRTYGYKQPSLILIFPAFYIVTQYSQCFDTHELNCKFQDKICRNSLFTVFAACGTD